MVVNLHYSTFMTALVYTKDNDQFTHPFYKCMTMQDAVNWAMGAMEYNALSIPSDVISGIIFMDSETGELLAEFTPE